MQDHNNTPETIPYGYCHCGCGGLAPIAPRSRSSRNEVKGEPKPYISGHKKRPRAGNRAGADHFMCSKCKVFKHKDMFFVDRSRPDGISYVCRECHSLDSRDYYERNRSDIRERYSAYYETNKDRILQRGKEYYRSNRERVASRGRRYYLANKDKKAAYSRNYRARRAKSGGTITPEEWQEVLLQFDGRCARCGSDDRIEMDHVVPLWRGGRHDISNVQPLCKSCNCEKHTKVMDFRGRMYRPLSLLIDEDAA